MTGAVADLTSLFCKPIAVAVLTFSHQFISNFASIVLRLMSRAE